MTGIPPGGGKRVPANAKDAVLEGVRAHGGMHKAAKAAGIAVQTLYSWMDADPAFSQAIRAARQELADDYAQELIEQARATGNPVGYIVRLKALRPEEYIEKHAILNVNANVTVTDEMATEVLRAMLGAARPETLAALQSGPLALLPPDEAPAG